MEKILVTGACGQIGTELVDSLRMKYGNENVIASGHRTQPPCKMRDCCPLHHLDVLDISQMEKIVFEYNIDAIYHMASILSAAGERNPHLTFEINMKGLYNVLEVARIHKLERVM